MSGAKIVVSLFSLFVSTAAIAVAPYYGERTLAAIKKLEITLTKLAIDSAPDKTPAGDDEKIYMNGHFYQFSESLSTCFRESAPVLLQAAKELEYFEPRRRLEELTAEVIEEGLSSADFETRNRMYKEVLYRREKMLPQLFELLKNSSDPEVRATGKRLIHFATSGGFKECVNTHTRHLRAAILQNLFTDYEVLP